MTAKEAMLSIMLAGVIALLATKVALNYRGKRQHEQEQLIQKKQDVYRAVTVINSTSDNHQIDIRGTNTVGHVMTVAGLHTVNHVTNLWYERPETADVVLVEIWTADGKRWRAKWIEQQENLNQK